MGRNWRTRWVSVCTCDPCPLSNRRPSRLSRIRASTTSPPVFSPDGQSLVYWSSNGAGQKSVLKRVDVTGGPVRTLTAILPVFGMSWGPDGILVGQGRGGIVRVSPNGGK